MTPRLLDLRESVSPLGLSPAQRGFTLIELVMVSILVGVLAVFVAPRLLDTRDIHARGLHDETLA